MARRSRTQPDGPPKRSSALVAAAAPVDITSAAQVKRITARQQRWQPEAWAYYKSIGTISDVLDYRANVASKVRLYAAWDPPGTDTAPIPVSAAVEEGFTTDAVASQAQRVLSDLDEGQGIAAMLHKLFLNLDVPGEAHVIGEDTPGEDTPDGRTWAAYSNSELRQSQGKLSVIEEPTDKRGRPVAPGAVAFRIWRPDPEFGALAYSAMRPLVESGVCERLLLLGNQIRSDLKSRLPKGIVAFAQEMSLGRAVNSNGDRAEIDQADGGSLWQDELISVMQAALTGDGGAADAVPIAVEVPSQLIASKAWADVLDLGKTLDPQVLELAQHLIDQIASGLPMPPEMVSGLGDTSHWSAATIERGGFRHYIEPGILSITHGLTLGFYRPMLLASGLDRSVVDRLVVWHDETDAITEKDRTEVSTTGVNIGALGREAWRRVNEFDEEDAPDDDELVKFIGLERGILTAELTSVLMALSKLIPQSAVIVDEPAAQTGPRELPPAPEAETDEEPDTLDEAKRPVTAAGPPTSNAGERLAAIDRRLFAQVSTAADMALERALERASNRLRSLANRNAQAAKLIRDVPGEQVAAKLGRSLVVQLAGADGEDDDTTVAALFAGAFTSLATRVDALTERAQQATVAEALAMALPEDRPTDGELAVLAAEQADDRERATSALTAALTALAVSVLFDGRPDPGEGEIDATAVVPASVVREALAFAGGAASVERTAAGGLTVEGRPVGGVATGERARTLFARVRAWWTGYRWEYGDAGTRARPFEPHRALSGRTFQRWDQSELANAETPWLPTTTYSPGDHRGCQCSFTPVVVQPVAEVQAA